jgi:hypothetical protein
MLNQEDHHRRHKNFLLNFIIIFYNKMGKSKKEESMTDSFASFGKLVMRVQLFFMVPIGIALIIFGITMLPKKDPHTKKVSAHIADAKCNLAQEGKKGKIKYHCGLKTTYKVDGEDCESVINTSDRERKIGESITLFYNPSNVCDSVLQPTNYKMTGGILIGVGAFILVYYIGQYYLGKRYKAVYAGKGGATLWNVFT